MTEDNSASPRCPPEARSREPVLNRPSHALFVVVAGLLNLLFMPTFGWASLRAARVARQRRGEPVMSRRSWVGATVVVLAVALVASLVYPLRDSWIRPGAAAVGRTDGVDDAEPRVPTHSGPPASPTATASPAPSEQHSVQSTTGTWVPPVRGPVVSGFRPADRRDHDGVDVAVPRGTTIRAASDGVVVTVLCNVAGRMHAPDSALQPCNRDGRPGLGGCGWYVDIRHPGDVVSRYCHMLVRPVVQVGNAVTTGQAIGQVGSSGNSSGPHLHLEILVRPTGPENPNGRYEPVDPVPFLAQRGVSLRRA